MVKAANTTHTKRQNHRLLHGQRARGLVAPRAADPRRADDGAAAASAVVSARQPAGLSSRSSRAWWRGVLKSGACVDATAGSVPSSGASFFLGLCAELA